MIKIVKKFKLKVSQVFNFAIFLKRVFTKKLQNDEVVLKKGTWSFDEVFIIAYIGFNYRTSNSELLEYISICMKRKKSTVVRRINRLRGVKSGKANDASKLDLNVVLLYDSKSESERFYQFCKNIQDLDSPSVSLGILDNLLLNSKKN
tara:strand:+ start:522 stop:965 length:444 start_codon:yes stop_codon:yes gene_type:complete